MHTMISLNSKALAESAVTIPYSDGAPPSYEQYEFDEICTSNESPSHQTSLQAAASPSGKSATTAAAPLSLTMDNSLIYPTIPPSAALYHIPRPLFFHGDRVYLQRSVARDPFPSGKQRRGLNEELYELRRIPYTDDREIALIARRPACYGENSRRTRMRRVRGLLGTTWEIVVDDVVVVKGHRGQWKHGSGPVIAREETLDLPLRCYNAEQQKISGVLVVLAGVEQQIQDLVVAAWCGKIWLLASDSMVNGAIVLMSKKWDKQQKALTDDMSKALGSDKSRLGI